MKPIVKGLLALFGIGTVTYFATRKAEGAPDGLPGPTPGPAPGSKLVYVTDPTSVKLKKDQWYRGRLFLKLPLLPFSATADEETIGKGLVALGFKDVRVFMGIASLPSDWPKETMPLAGPNTRWFSGQWGGLTGPMPKPPQVESMWITRSPTLVTAQAARASGDYVQDEIGCG